MIAAKVGSTFSKTPPKTTGPDLLPGNAAADNNDTAAAATAAASVVPLPFVADLSRHDGPIRSWGCDRTETPLIFVHIGKSGGGGIRARLAASARNYSRPGGRWMHSADDNHYYPIASGGTADRPPVRHGKLCNAQYLHYTHTPHADFVLVTTFGRLRPCNATTPLGIALACPHPSRGGRHARGGINTGSYQNSHCQKCDDDFYLDVDFYSLQGGRTVGRRLQGTPPKPPPRLDRKVLDPANDPPAGETCAIVFVAHNNIGSELNWLPPRYLKQHWWDRSEYGTAKVTAEPLAKYWDALLDDRHRRRSRLAAVLRPELRDDTEGVEGGEDASRRWCPQGYPSPSGGTIYHRPSKREEYTNAYTPCGLPLALDADGAFRDAFANTTTIGADNYSPIYASMPLHRITVLRDPWSWVVSKFFWHGIEQWVPKRDDGHPPCYDVHHLTNPWSAKNTTANPKNPITGVGLSWMEQFSLVFLIKLCGNDCLIRYENGMMDVRCLEDQAAANVRAAFSVVGLLHEEQSFFDMVTDRISYVDLTLNPTVRGQSHATRKTPANLACKKLFGTNETFRRSVRDTMPAFAAIERIYHLGVKVNAFQKEELRQCKLQRK